MNTPAIFKSRIVQLGALTSVLLIAILFLFGAPWWLALAPIWIVLICVGLTVWMLSDKDVR